MSRPENSEDVSWSVVPGSSGTAGAAVVPWAARANPASDEARAREMARINEILGRFRKRIPRVPTRAELNERHAKYLEWKDATLGQFSSEGRRR
jgi:hypothetical protein